MCQYCYKILASFERGLLLSNLATGSHRRGSPRKLKSGAARTRFLSSLGAPPSARASRSFLRRSRNAHCLRSHCRRGTRRSRACPSSSKALAAASRRRSSRRRRQSSRPRALMAHCPNALLLELRRIRLPLRRRGYSSALRWFVGWSLFAQCSSALWQSALLDVDTIGAKARLP